MVMLVVMGVSGCGKTTVGRALAARFGVPFLEGDERHPRENIARMAQGIPLTDADRKPWLEALGAELAGHRDGAGAVLTCSALKKSYRDLLRAAAGPALRFLHLTGSRAVLLDRMAHRSGHFMPATLLDSQLATLEPTDGEADVLALDCDTPLAEIEAALERFLG